MNCLQLDLYDVLSQQPAGSYSTVAANHYRELLGKNHYWMSSNCLVTMYSHLLIVHTLFFYLLALMYSTDSPLSLSPPPFLYICIEKKIYIFQTGTSEELVWEFADCRQFGII